MTTLSQQLNQQIAETERQRREAEQQLEARRQAERAPERTIAQAAVQLTTLRQRQREAVLEDAAAHNGELVQANREAVQALRTALDAALPQLASLREKADAVHATFDVQQNAANDAIGTFVRGIPDSLNAQYEAQGQAGDTQMANVHLRHLRIGEDVQSVAARAFEQFQVNGIDAIPVVVEWMSQADTPEEGWMRFGVFYALFGFMTDARYGDTAEKLTEREIYRRRNGGR